MRNIKFRGIKRSPYGDKWVYGYYALEDGEHIIIMPHGTSYEKALKENEPILPISAKHTIDYNTLGQFTGLHDKNGKEIYEGDIVKLDSNMLKITGIITYHSNEAVFVLEDLHDEIEECLWYMQEDLEVIGNIYEDDEECPTK